jgi:hypothetical protein
MRWTASPVSRVLDERVRTAIAEKRLMRLTYHDRPRVIEPHDYGVLNGTVKLFVSQVSANGASRNGEAERWRLLEVSKITECTVLDEHFRGSRGDSYSRHLKWEILYARVE